MPVAPKPQGPTRALGLSRRRRPRLMIATSGRVRARSLGAARFRSCGRKRRRVQSGFPPGLVRGAPGDSKPPVSAEGRRVRAAGRTLTRRRPVSPSLPGCEDGAVQGVLGSGCSVGFGRRPWTLCHPEAAVGPLWSCVASPSVRALEREEHF